MGFGWRGWSNQDGFLAVVSGPVDAARGCALLLEAFWWGSVFLLGVPVMVLLLVTAPVLLPEYRDAEAGRLDLASVALSLATVLPIICGIQQLATDGLAVLPVAAIVVGGIYLFITQYLQLVEDLSQLVARLWLLPPAFALIVASMLTPIVARTVRPGHLVGAAMLVAAVGYLVLALVDSAAGLPPDGRVHPRLHRQRPVMEFGIALGVAILGVVATTIYPSEVSGTVSARFR